MSKKEAKQASGDKGPKKSPNEFIFFMKMKGSELAKKMSEEKNVPYRECVTEISKIYNAYSDDEKAPYRAAREQDKERYEKELAQFQNKTQKNSQSQI